MALDVQVLASRLAGLEEYLRFLDKAAQLDLATFTSDPRNYASAERFLQLAIEAVLDMGTHCVSALGLTRPERYAEILPMLAGAGVIRQETAVELTSLAGFRNLLVHEYMKIDRTRVHQFLQTRLTGFRHFASDLSAYLERSSRSQGQT